MTTSGEPSKASPAKRPAEPFEPPGATSLATLTDEREAGDTATRYDCCCWVQISVELAYLFIVLGLSFAGLFLLSLYAVQRPTAGIIFSILGPYPASVNLVAYAGTVSV